MWCRHSPQPRTDHPRACGANLISLSAITLRIGSSPRMRGKRGRGDETVLEVRIIPAHAGQTAPRRAWTLAPPDHPRACGANRDGKAENPMADGSSPRMRGKRWLSRCRRRSLRIIPAHAGQTSKVRRSVTHSPDHPRACGANKTETTSIPEIDGSSPRMRGKPGYCRI